MSHTAAVEVLADLSTERQRAFVLEYVKDHNATQAAIRAGYSSSNAGRTGADLRRHPKVRQAIVELEQRMADELGITKRWLLERMRDVVVSGLQRVPMTYQGGTVVQSCDLGEACTVDDCPGDGSRDHPVYVAANLQTAHAALRTLMDHRGMLDKTSRVEVDGIVRYELAGVDVDALT